MDKKTCSICIEIIIETENLYYSLELLRYRNFLTGINLVINDI